MKIVKKIVKWIACFLLIPVIYLLISLVLTSITVNEKLDEKDMDKSIFLTSNGVHLDIVLPKENIDSLLLSGLYHKASDNFLAFGWGDENFYLKTPTWADLTFKNAFIAVFLKSSSLVHLTRYQMKVDDWIEIRVTESELKKLNAYLLETFSLNEAGEKMMLSDTGYSSRDNFYKAKGSFSCFKTCNSWVNSGLKESGMKACYWTPFDFGLINKYN